MELEYEPLSDAELDAPTALLQAAHVLDIAASYAVESKNIEHMMSIAHSFCLIADRLDPSSAPEQKNSFGFHGHEEDVTMEEQDE